MPHPLTIRLTDGCLFDIDEDEWLTSACPVHAAMRDDGEYANEQLFVRKHDDGRTLVYVVIERPGADTTVAGELLPGGSSEVESAVWRIAELFAIPAWLVERCLEALSKPTLG